MMLVNASTLSFLPAVLNRSNRFQSHNHYTKTLGNTKGIKGSIRNTSSAKRVHSTDNMEGVSNESDCNKRRKL